MNFSMILLAGFLAVTLHGVDSCKKNQQSSDDIKAVSLLYHIPYIHETGSITDIDNRYIAYQKGDLNLYRFSYNYDSLSDEVPVLKEIRFHYFVHHKDSTSGYIFDPNGWVHELPATVDSMKIFRFENPKWDTITRMKTDSSFRMSNGDLVNVYHFPSSSQFEGSFSYYFYYTDSIQGIRESFSKTLEKVHRKKLYRIRMLRHPFYYEPYKKMIENMEAYYEMKLIPVENPNELSQYFERYLVLTKKR